MAKKTVVLCDRCEQRIDGRQAARLEISGPNGRLVRALDLCPRCVGLLPGIAHARRGRRFRAQELAHG
jgi:hypothetical protein